MDRRRFLHALSTLAAGGLCAACAREVGTATGTSGQTPGAASAPEFDPVGRVAADAREALSIVSGSFEQLVGDAQPYAFGVFGADGQPLNGAELSVHVVPIEGEPTGPFPTDFHGVKGLPTGLYVANVDIPAAAAEAGAAAFVAVSANEAQAGADTLRVATADGSALPAPGQKAPRTPTPTKDEPLGYERLCTEDPPCGMHNVGLVEALEAGRPIVLLFATPAYCQTAVCGPSVTVLDEVRAGRQWGDVAFIHCEIYADAGQSLGEPVSEWGLPSEPWLFAIGPDGTIVRRADGPLLTLPDQVAAMVRAVSS